MRGAVVVAVGAAREESDPLKRPVGRRLVAGSPSAAELGRARAGCSVAGSGLRSLPSPPPSLRHRHQGPAKKSTTVVSTPSSYDQVGDLAQRVRGGMAPAVREGVLLRSGELWIRIPPPGLPSASARRGGRARDADAVPHDVALFPLASPLDGNEELHASLCSVCSSALVRPTRSSALGVAFVFVPVHREADFPHKLRSCGRVFRTCTLFMKNYQFRFRSWPPCGPA